MRFVDSHLHLADPAFDADRDAVVERARAAGAVALVVIGESLAAAERAAALAELYPAVVFSTAGVHPHEAAGWSPGHDADRIRQFARRGAVAIGECGLDYHYDHAPRTQQRRAFADQLALAKEIGLPVVVHTREAADDTAALVEEAGRAGILGVLHCFSGPPSLAETALRAGWYLSFSGIVTFRKWDGASLVRDVPVDRLLVETDAPYLAPVPHRGRRNEPAHAALTIAAIARMRDVDEESIGEASIRNASRLFGLAIAASAP